MLNQFLLIPIRLSKILYVNQSKVVDAVLLIDIMNLKLVMMFLKNISKEMNVCILICNLLRKHFKFLNKDEKLHAKEFHSKYEDYRDTIQEEKTDCINDKLNMLPTHEQLPKLDINKTQMKF